MRHTTANAVGRRALIKGTAVLACRPWRLERRVQPPPAEQATPLGDAPLGPG